MALWITTPALLLLFLVRRHDKYVVALLVTALLVALPSLLHGEIGFTQFGYRFSLDYIIFLLLPLAAVFERINWRWVAAFVGASVLINFWVVILFQVGRFHY